jgi:hypothetical protein
MTHNQITSLIVTASGVFGGVGKAISSYFVLVNITFHGTVELVFYAAVSAVVAYGVTVFLANSTMKNHSPLKKIFQ